MTTVVGVPPGVTASGYKAVPFTPAALPGLTAWWDASVPASLIGADVSVKVDEWRDLSGNVHTLFPETAGVARKVIVNGLPTVGQTGGASNFNALRCPGWNRNPVETIVGAIWVSEAEMTEWNPAGFPMWDDIEAGDHWFQKSGAAQWAWGWNIGYISFAGPTLAQLGNSFHIYATCSNGASSWAEIDRGAYRGTGTSDTGTTTGFQLSTVGWAGWDTGAPSAIGKGNGEVIIVNGAMSAGDLTKTYNYLKTKWGTP